MRPNYTVRTKYRIAIFLWLVNGSALGLGTVYVSDYFIIPLLFFLMLVIGLYTILLRCPHCAKRVLYNPFTFLGTTIWIWTSWIPKRCTRCGKELE
jgi:hypothetical protein